MNTQGKGFAALAATILLASSPLPSWAHGGHDDAFAEKQAAPATGQVAVSPEVQKAMGLVVSPVEEKILDSGFSVSGKIEAIPSRSADVNAPVAGRVLTLSAALGQAVRAGQILVTLDSPEVRQLAVEAERGKAQARAVLAQTAAKLRLAEANYQREQELVQLRISARKDFQVAEAERDQARADLEAARAQVRLAGALLTSRLAQLGQRGVSARADGSVAITSPLAGLVAVQRVTTGEAVEPGKSLYKIIDLSEVWATAAVYEKDLAKIRPGQSVALSTTAYPGRLFRGRVASADPTVDPDTRTIGVRAVLANPGGLLKPGMFTSLRLVTGKGSGPVPVLPRSAVLDSDGEQIVYVQNGDAFVPTPVQLGRVSGDLVEVKDGVFPGDLVVTQRAFQLRAQALKGDLPAEVSASGQVKAETSAPTPSTNTLPLWAWVGGGVLIAAGSFVAGLQVAKRSTPSAGPEGQSTSTQFSQRTRR